MKKSLIILFFLSIVSLCFSASSPPDLKPEVKKTFVSDNQETVVIDMNLEAIDFETIIIEKHEALFGSNCRHVLKSEAIYINKTTFAFRNKITNTIME